MWKYVLSAGVVLLAVAGVTVLTTRPAPPPTLLVLRSAALPEGLVDVVEEIARRHGPDDPAIRVVHHAYPTARADIVDRVRRSLDENDPLAVIDLGSSNEALVAAPLIERAGVPHILPLATSATLRRSTMTTFPILPTDSTEGAALARFVVERLGLREIAFFYQDSEHGVGIREGFTSALEALDARMLVSVPFTYVGDPDVIVEAALLRGLPDGVVVAGYPTTGGAVAGAVRRRLPDTPILGSDGLGSNPAPLHRRMGADRDPLYLATFWTASSSRRCAEGFPDWLGAVLDSEPAALAGPVHDAVAPVARAVTEGRDRPDAIVTFLRSLGLSRAGFPGVTGEVQYGPRESVPLLVKGPGDTLFTFEGSDR